MECPLIDSYTVSVLSLRYIRHTVTLGIDLSIVTVGLPFVESVSEVFSRPKLVDSVLINQEVHASCPPLEQDRTDIAYIKVLHGN